MSFKPDFKKAINVTVFQILICKVMRQRLIFLKTQLDFFYPFPYITTKKCSVESETIIILAVAVADSTPPHNGRVVRCVNFLTRKQSSQQSSHTWNENCSCKKSWRKLMWHLGLFTGAKPCEFTLLLSHK